jgi:nitrogenase subunit NifH
VYRSVIPRSVRLSEAPSHGLPIALYSPDSKGADAYRDLSHEFRSPRESRSPHGTGGGPAADAAALAAQASRISASPLAVIEP